MGDELNLPRTRYYYKASVKDIVCNAVFSLLKNKQMIVSSLYELCNMMIDKKGIVCVTRLSQEDKSSTRVTLRFTRVLT